VTALKHWLIFILICVSGSLGATAQEVKPLRGVALIIGQSNYAHIQPLPNAGQDARAIGKLLTDLGFETRNAPDRNAKALKREIERFIEDAEGADVAFVYYAGHGIEAAGENWLVPVDADLSALDDAASRLVAASPIVDRLKDTVPVVIFLLDACRNSPFPANALLKPDAQSAAAPIVQTGLMPSRGVALIEDQPAPIENVGVVMGFAAEPGKAALDGPKDGNSPYAAALLRHLSASNGAAFGDVMTMVTEEVYLDTGTRQRPWINASMRRLLYFGMTPEAGDKDEAQITGERRQLLLTIANLPQLGRRQVESIARSDQVPLDSLYGMLRAMGAATPKDAVELDSVLRAQAERLKTILAEASALKNADPEMTRLSSLADRAVSEGALETALAFREQAKKRATSVSDALANTEAALQQRRLEIAKVFAKSAATNELAFNFEAAAADYAKAFEQVERWDRKQAWTYKFAEAYALNNQGTYKGGTDALRKAIKSFEEADRFVTQENDPEAWARTRANLALAMKNLGERESGVDTLRKSVGFMEATLSAKAFDNASAERVDLRNYLAMALWKLGDREVDTKSLELAVQIFDAAMADLPNGDPGIKRALIENNRGVVLMSIGERESGTRNLDEAIAVFERGLTIFNKSETAYNWVMTQNNLGQALRLKGEREGGTETLQRSVDAFRAALSLVPRKEMPVSWSATTTNLGLALWRLGERKADNTTLNEAARTIASALEEVRREEAPLGWAGLQNSRGLVHLSLGEREPGTENLTNAVLAFGLALAERKREIVPLQWAESQNNLGTALLALGQREWGTTSLHRAVGAFEAALTETTRDRLPLGWASALTNLGITLTEIGIRDDDISSFDRSIIVLRDALKEGTRERVPARWMQTQFFLGSALLERGRLTDNKADLEQAKLELTTLLDFVRPTGDTTKISQLEYRLGEIAGILSELQ
jgi:uncharacterized caspase-like protein